MLSRPDIGTTPRGRLTERDRLAAWERTGGICVICHRPIDPLKQRWLVEHVRALELGGADTAENRGPAHVLVCARLKTAEDHRRAAKAKRAKGFHIGAFVPPKRVIDGSRASPWKKHVNGRVERRHHPEHSA